MQSAKHFAAEFFTHFIYYVLGRNRGLERWSILSKITKIIRYGVVIKPSICSTQENKHLTTFTLLLKCNHQ